MIGTIQEAVKNVGRCPRCGSAMVAMSKGNGLRCAKPGNRWLPGERRWSQCDYSIFLQATDDPTKFVIRPATFPEIATPTEQQKSFRSAMVNRGSRLIISNAGPGCAKTSTVSWALQGVHERLGNLSDFNLLAFNRNAKDVLVSKLPYSVPDIYTMNGFGMRSQGYKAEQIDDRKLRTLFRMVSRGKYEFGKVGDLIERMRSWALYAPSSESTWWRKAIDATIERFGMLDSLPISRATEAREMFYEVVPQVCELSLREGHKIDLTEQWFRPVADAIHRTGNFLPPEMLKRGYVFSDDLVRQMAMIVREIEAKSVKGMVLDEAQDLSLGQMLYFLACTWRSSEVVLIGDDREGKRGEPGYKAGQGIYGWRGSFGGSMRLFGRIWKELTGEVPTEIPLSVTHRCSWEVVQALKPLNSVLTTSRPEGTGAALETTWNMAFRSWAELPETTTAFWITRTNKEAAKVFIATVKSRIKCAFRGGYNFPNQVTRILEEASGVKMEADGRFRGTSLDIVQTELRNYLEGFSQQEREEMIESFVLAVVEEIKNDPSVLSVVGLDSLATVGNARKFLLCFADNNATKTIANVYRVKGDEAKWVFVSDAERFNSAWGGDEEEAAACRHVACSRAIDVLIVVGHLDGIDTKPMDEKQNLLTNPW